MQKSIAFSILIALSAAVLMGCQAAPSVGPAPGIEKIELYQLEGFTTDPSVLLKTITAEAQIREILEAIETSDKIEGILNVTEPSYCLKLYYKRGEVKTYYLWLEQSGADYRGMIMDAEDTHTGYTLKKESARYLFELVAP